MSDAGAAHSFGNVAPLWRTASDQSQFNSWASGLNAKEGQGKPTGFSSFSPSDRSDGPVSSANADGDIFDVAYKKGWEDGQAAFVEHQSEAGQARDALADALAHVNDLSSAGSSGFILEAVESLFRRCAELAVPDPALLRAWSAQLADLVDQDQKGVTLVLHPEDLALIDTDACKLALRGDETMLRGNLRLSHSGGWIEKGSAVVLDELRALIDEFSSGSEAGHD